MQASRASSRALKHLAAGSKQTRNLHMTGPATFSSLLTSERPALNLPRDVAGLRAECQKRKLPTVGTKAELIDRLSVHAFSTTVKDSKRPVPEPANPGQAVRHFNTSRSLKAVKDSSTIDFAYVPDFVPDAQESPVANVPIVTDAASLESNGLNKAEEIEEAVMLPNILTVAADGTHIHAPSAMAEVSDNNAVDFQGLVAQVASKFGSPAEGQSMTRELWSSLVDDLFGPKGQKPSGA